MEIEVVVKIVVSFLPVFAYALNELKKAHEVGEKVRWAEIVKTTVLAAVSAGVVSSNTGTDLISLIESAFFANLGTYYLDKLFNAIMERLGYVRN